MINQAGESTLDAAAATSLLAAQVCPDGFAFCNANRLAFEFAMAG